MNGFLLVLKYLLLVVVAIAVLTGGGFFVVWAADRYKWGWIEVPVHYRLSFEVEVGGVAYPGSTVVQVTYTRVPTWQTMYQPTDWALYSGQAAIVSLPDGKMICLLPNGKLFGKRHYSVAAIADRVITSDGPAKAMDWERHRIGVDAAAGVSGSAEIPFEFLPVMIVLDDPARPTSAHIFDPLQPERTLGPGARFLGARIAVTHEPVSTGIETVLMWLHDPAVPQWLTDRQDPFTKENHGQPLYKAEFH